MILFLTQCFPSRLGGIESLVSNLALGLGRFEKIVVFADRHHYYNDAVFDNKYKNEIIIKRVGGLKYFRRRKKIKEIKAFIESKQVKLVLADTWKSLELGIDYLNEKNIPVVCLAHGNELLSDNNAKKLRIKTTLNKANAVISNSIFTNNLLKNIISAKVNLLTIYPGAEDLHNINISEIEGIEGNPILLTLARLEKRKGHLKIIDVIQKLIPEFPNILYVIAGIGPELKNLKKIVKEKRLNQNIKFVGKVDNYQKKYLFQKTQLMLMPTLDEAHNRSIEGFGIAYIEAAFFSIPSIASNVGGTPEAVIHNSTGLILNRVDDLFSKTRDLLFEKNKMHELGQNAKKRAIENFHWDNITNQYLSLINKIIKTK